MSKPLNADPAAWDAYIKCAPSFTAAQDRMEQAVAAEVNFGDMMGLQKERYSVNVEVVSHELDGSETIAARRGFGIPATSPRVALAEAGEMLMSLSALRNVFRDALKLADGEAIDALGLLLPEVAHVLGEPLFIGDPKVTITEGDQLGFPWNREIGEMCRVKFSGGQEFERRAYRDESKPTEWLRIRDDIDGPVTPVEIRALERLAAREARQQDEIAHADSQMGDPYP